MLILTEFSSWTVRSGRRGVRRIACERNSRGRVMPSSPARAARGRTRGRRNAVDGRNDRDSQKAGAQGKKREPHRCGARRGVPERRDRQGESDRDQAQRRRARLCAPLSAGGRVSAAIGGAFPVPSLLRRGKLGPALSYDSREERKAGMGLCRGRDRRDATGEVRGHPPIGVQMAARRSEKRRFRLLRAHAGRGPLLLRRPLPNGLSPADGKTDPAGTAKRPCAC